MSASESAHPPEPACIPPAKNRPLGYTGKGSVDFLHSLITDRFNSPKVPGLRTLVQVQEHIREVGSEKFEQDFLEAQPKIEFAALAFRMPATFLACLIFKESRFDEKAKSSKGAEGIMQMIPIAKKEVREILQKGEKVRKENADSLHARLLDDWDEYHRLRETKPGLKLNSPDSSREIAGVAGGSVLLRYYLSRMAKNPEKPTAEDLLVTAGAYNLGITEATRTCGNKTGKACRLALEEHNPETRSHIQKIEECMKRRRASSR